MIELVRVRTDPPVHKNFFGAKRVAVNLKLLKQKRDGELEASGEKKWDSSFWKESKTQLLDESNNKCAYCETPTAVVAYGDVEHFRPKSVYWWLAYSYENYLPSCAICNQRYKKDKFALEEKTLQQTGPSITATMTDEELEVLAPKLTVDPINNADGKDLEEFKNEHQSEKPLIINPYLDDPATYFAYQPILGNNEVLVVPAKVKYKKVIKACEDLFGLNRPELRDLRFQQYCFYMTFRHTLADSGISAGTRAMCQARLTQMSSGRSAYAGMIRYFETVPLEALPWDFNIQINL
jgi:uncharacterized protein (TIGR02646 family)